MSLPVIIAALLCAFGGAPAHHVSRAHQHENSRRGVSLSGRETASGVLDDKYVLNEFDSSPLATPAASRRYHYARQPVAVTDSGGTRFLGVDALGSVTDETGGAGASVAKRQYDAWGQYRNGTAPTAAEPKLGFTGHQYDDETGLTYARARYLDNKLGVFLSRDTLEGSLNDAPSLHRFAYVKNNPTRFVDPDGREAWGDSIFGPLAALFGIESGQRQEFEQARTSAVATLASSAGGDLATARATGSPQQSVAMTKMAAQFEYGLYRQSVSTLHSVVHESAFKVGAVCQVTSSAALPTAVSSALEFAGGAVTSPFALGMLPETVMRSGGEFDAAQEQMMSGASTGNWEQFGYGSARMSGTIGLWAGLASGPAGLVRGRAAAPAVETFQSADAMNSFTATGSEIAHAEGVTRFGSDAASIRVATNAAREEAFHDVVAHGTQYDEQGAIFQVDYLPTHTAQIAEGVRANPSYSPGQPVRLLTCWGGCGPAQELSNLLGVKVRGATDVVNVPRAPNSTPSVANGGTWQDFLPEQK